MEIRPAWSDKFWEYREVKPAPASEFQILINTEVFGTGLHWLRVSQLDLDGEVKDGSICEVLVVFLWS